MENNERIDDTPIHKAIREAFVNLIIHSDYLLDAGTLKVIKLADGYEFTNPAILHAWRTQGWEEPELCEDTTLNQVTLRLKMISKEKESLEELSNGISENTNETIQRLSESAEKSAESADKEIQLSERQKQILDIMDTCQEYSVGEIAALIGLKEPRTRQLLNALVSMNKVKVTASNMVGLNRAATPAGLKAMEELAKLEEERGNEAYLDKTRNKVRAARLATMVSTAAAVVFCKGMDKGKNKNEPK